MAQAERLLNEFEKETEGMRLADVSMLRSDVYRLLHLIERQNAGTLEQHGQGQLFAGLGTREQHGKEQPGGGTRDQLDEERNLFWLTVYSQYALELKKG